METKKNNQNGKVFQKYFGVTGAFLTGVALFWWGINIMLNDWFAVREAYGPLGNMVLAPLIIGAALSFLAGARFIEIIKEVK